VRDGIREPPVLEQKRVAPRLHPEDRVEQVKAVIEPALDPCWAGHQRAI
jgi:hypothetical protein